MHKLGSEQFVKFVTSWYGFDVMPTPVEFDHPHASPVTKDVSKLVTSLTNCTTPHRTLLLCFLSPLNHLQLVVVLPAPLLWLGWPCAAPPPRLLRALRPIPFGVGVICDIYFLVLLLQPLQLAALHLEICPY